MNQAKRREMQDFEATPHRAPSPSPTSASSSARLQQIVERLRGVSMRLATRSESSSPLGLARTFANSPTSHTTQLVSLKHLHGAFAFDPPTLQLPKEG